MYEDSEVHKTFTRISEDINEKIQDFNSDFKLFLNKIMMNSTQFQRRQKEIKKGNSKTKRLVITIIGAIEVCQINYESIFSH